MIERLGELVRRLLAGGSMTHEALHTAIAREDPALVVRGPDWLGRWLTRFPAVTFEGGRYRLLKGEEDEEPTDQRGDVGLSTPEVDRTIAARFVVFDLEANADRAQITDHEIIEIAAFRVVDGRVGERFATLVRPERPIDGEVIALTGLTDEDVDGAPGVAEALGEFLEFVGDDALVAHNGLGYDFQVLDATCLRAGLPTPTGVRLDTLELAHVVFPRAGEELTVSIDGSVPPIGRGLEVLARHVGVSIDGDLHRAEADAALLVEVTARLTAELQRAEPRLELARWVLQRSGHPWGAFVDHVEDRPDLIDVVPLPSPPDVPPPTHDFSPSGVAAMFEPGGVLLADGRTHRKQQGQMAGLVANALADSSSQLIEAPTGTGKTLAYLAPAVAYSRAVGQPVIVATHSKVLQNQVLTNLRQLQGTFGDIGTVLLKGRENYLSVEALDAMLDDPPNDPDIGLALAVLCSWVGITPTGEWDDLRVWVLSWNRAFDRLQWQLRVDSDTGLALDDLEERCFYRRAKEGMADAEVAVLNHAVVVSRNDWREHAAHLILDEAHNLEDAATAALSEQVTEADVIRILAAVHDRDRRWGTLSRWCDATGTSARFEQAQNVRAAVRAAEQATSTLSAVLVDFLRARAGARRAEVEKFGASVRLVEFERRRSGFGRVRSGVAGLSAALRAVAGELDKLEVPSDLRKRYRRRRLEQEIARLGRQLREAASLVYEVGLGIEDPEAPAAENRLDIADLAVDDGRYTWGLRRVPVSVAPTLMDLWQSLETVVLTSATLRVRGSFEFVQRRLGLDTAQARDLDTPFDRLHEQQLVVLTDHLPAPTGELIDAFTIAQTDELARLFTLSRGRAMALFAARARMEHAYEHVAPLLDIKRIPVLCQGHAPAPALIEAMRTDRATSLLATRSFWEGIDVPGEFLSLLVIEKLPFDSPGDPIVAARVDMIERRGGDPFDEYLVPQAAIRFAQGVGRLIRTQDDVGAVVVLDRRLRRPLPYRDAFLSVLPGRPRIVRPLSAAEGYAAIAEHLKLPWDGSIQAELAALPTSDPWAFLNELQVDDEEAKDAVIVEAKLDEVRQRLGFAAWRPGQLDIMKRLIAGLDVVAILPTGAGKSITYQIPALLRPGVTLVVSPLIALMRDQVRRLRERGILGVGALYAGMSQSQQEEVLASARAGQVRLLYVSPERLWAKRLRSALRDLDVARVVVDEAHCVSQWGHSFRPEYAEIPRAVREIVGGSGREPATAAMTATATADVRKEMCELLDIASDDAPVLGDPDRPELRYYAVDCENREARDLTVVKVVESFRDQPVIVYAPRREDTTRLMGLLRAANHRAMAYHGGMESEERLHVEEAFVDNEVAVVVATKAFGLGIDKPDIAAVIHLEMPASVEEYIQETGRAARGAMEGGEPTFGVCVLLRMPRDCGIHRRFVKSAAPAVELLRRVYEAVPDRWVGPLEELVADDGQEEVGLAASYLVRAGLLERGEDLAWRGRVYVPDDAETVLADVMTRDPVLAERGSVILAIADRLGTEEYHAPRWADATDLSMAQVEDALLELSRLGVVGFVNWEFAWQLTRTEERPDWRSLELALRDRRDKVQRLSDTAKDYRRQDKQCRRAWLLWYLDGDPDLECDSCDVCRPDVPKPWEEIEISADSLNASVPAGFVVLALVSDLQVYGYARRTVEMVLCGAELQYNKHLTDHHLYGALESLGRDEVTRRVDRLIADGLVQERDVTHETTAHTALELTEEGRRQLA